MNMKRITAAAAAAGIIFGTAGSGMQMINAEEPETNFTVSHQDGLEPSGTYNTVSWTIDEEGTLTISGSGYISNVITGQEVHGHWFTYIPDSVKKIVIEEGITGIEAHTFDSCKVVSVDIASSVKRIKAGAFEYCTVLENVNLPEGLQKIENDAFYGCSKLKSIKIPESVKNIGAWAFGFCDNLEEVIFPDSLPEFSEGVPEYYDENAFSDTPWYSNYINQKTETAADTSGNMKGDVSGDGIIDISDITLLSLYLIGDTKLDENQQKAADTDGNSEVNLADLARLMQFISKKIDSL